MSILTKTLFSKKLVLCSIISASLLASSVSIASQSIKQYPPKDPGVINKERIAYWLQKRGEIEKDASQETIDKAVKKYTRRASTNSIALKYSVPNIRKKRNLDLTKSKIAAPKTVKVLTVLVDFPDLPFDDNRITASDTNMFYSSYTVEHYRDLMFSTSGFSGPSNQNLQSAYQYYQQETGNDFFLTGEAYGWVTADSDSDVYGENDPENNE